DVGADDATDVRVVDGGTITAVTPRSPKPGTVSVSVTNPHGGTGTLANAFTYTNVLPAATVGLIPSPQSGNIVVPFTLADLDSDLVDITLEIDPGTGVFQPVPPSAVVAGGLTSLATSPEGVAHTLAFDSRAIFDQQNLAQVRVRVTPFDDEGVGTPGISPPF